MVAKRQFRSNPTFSSCNRSPFETRPHSWQEDPELKDFRRFDTSSGFQVLLFALGLCSVAAFAVATSLQKTVLIV